ncbi:hypothetical protein H0266_13945 [Halobacillus locisalis]|uniref:Uncharacterized protein n=1 Tax=Halobacillus locisalis TaxID=220753 RepID=A0A838CVN7_9BACI|nr:hypothetical protein [Halobacillus locisalis]MBA2175994.1 hypothetical protein [Halobacillus locisalis]
MKENKVASAIFAVGFFMITIGIVTGIMFDLSLLLTGVVSGIVFIGFSEVIRLLQGIYNQGDIMIRASSSTASESEILSGDDGNQVKAMSAHGVSEGERNEIVEFYSSKGLKVENISATDQEDYFIVKVNGREELVELGGFKPIVHS